MYPDVKNRITQGFSRMRSVGFKLFILFLISIVAGCAVSGWTVYSISTTALQEKVGNNAQQVTQDAAKNVDLWYKQMEGFFNSIALYATSNQALTQQRSKLVPLIDTDLAEYQKLQGRIATLNTQIQKMNDALKPGDSKSKEQYMLEVERDNLIKNAEQLNKPKSDADKALLNYMQNTTLTNNAMIFSVSMIRYNGENQQFIPQSSKAKPQLYSLPWVDQVIKAKGKNVYLPPQAGSFTYENNTRVFGIAKAFWSSEDAVWTDVLIVEYKLSYFEDILKAITFGGIGDIHLLGTDGTTYFTNRSGIELGQPAAVKVDPESNGNLSRYVDAQKNSYITVSKNLENQPWLLVGAIPESRLLEDASKIKNSFYWLISGSILLSLALGWLVYYNIGRPMLTAQRKMQQAEQGDLSVRLGFKRTDEIGSVSTSFDRMMESISHIVSNTGGSAKQLLHSSNRIQELVVLNESASKEIAVAMDEVAKGAMNLASDAEKSNELTGRLHHCLDDVMDKNTKMQQVSEQMKTASHQGLTTMEELSEQSRMVESIVKDLNQKMQQLQDSTNSVSVVLDLLQDISKKINILSLNAAIVAASSGEAGKSFMVVAQEIRNLASQSQQSINSAGDVIERIQTDMQQTNHLVSQSMPIFSRQLAASDASQDIFSSVSKSMQEFSERFGEVWESLRISLEAGKELNEVLMQVSAVSEEFTASTENVANLVVKQNESSTQLVDTGKELEQLSHDLRESLGIFKQ
ncbi:methyl-accepting chemotaxis protein [Paenibacillus allorhizosphaerae]|uniref:Methyl-accepting chemotaxis protein n=1 Tax=Paenibacillus allorhizosphaerae TaxID=2849866 RepID=A0ABM8VTQ8_9BACL|nr:methyl-accepting chemotaxis protein [Paenibacillus allorhizosphaerae]CAG7657853.1 hypothetical protein PAECIP111802_06877 [Paenibacillus allorhizosphaerae]